MRNDYKYVGYGLVVGLFGMGLIVTSIVAATGNTPPPLTIASPAFINLPEPISPSSTPIFTATLSLPSQTPTPTISIPTVTNNADVIKQMIANGQMQISGPLSKDQQIALYNASLNYIARTRSLSLFTSRRINGNANSDPTNICGPLALIIMQDADLIETRDVVPYDFWLLNPYIPKDRELIDRVFPKDRYEDTLIKTPIHKFDWKAFPLQPGDFLFIKHGTGGNFDHMLVVNRVDRQMRAFAVTNYGTSGGYIINEVMLYDPNDPKAGMFHTWTKEQFAILGSTGFGGFEIWRLRSQQ